jgi:uncharacterized protein involved in exopolysaccharide biosynthesis
MADTATTRPSSRPTGDEEIELGQLIGTLLAGKWIIAAFIVMAVAIGGWQAYTATPIYKGDMLLQVERQGRPRFPASATSSARRRWRPTPRSSCCARAW